MDIKPLDVKVKKALMNNGSMLDVISFDQYASNTELYSSHTVGIMEEVNGVDIVLPYKGNYTNSSQNTPGLYNAGCIDFEVLPDEDNIDDYVPKKIVEMSNRDNMGKYLASTEMVKKLDEAWITTADNVTQLPVNEDDSAEMKCLKYALNEKNMDLDKYAGRFGDNYPNDKRQLKNKSATLNIIKRYCQNCDMEALLVLRDKSPDVPNPIGKEIVVSLTDDDKDDEN